MPIKVYGEDVVVIRTKRALETRYIKGEIDKRGYRLALGFIHAWELLNTNYSDTQYPVKFKSYFPALGIQGTEEERKEKAFPFELVRPIDNVGGRLLIRKR